MTELFTMIVLAANAMSSAIFAKSFGDRAVARVPARNTRRQISRGLVRGCVNWR
jgi:hypothetical protein